MYIPVSQSPIGCRFIEDFGLVGRAGAAALCFYPGALDYSRLRRGRYRQLSHRTPVFPCTLTSSFSHRLPCNWVRHHESLRSMGGSSSRGRFQALIFLPRIRPCFPERLSELCVCTTFVTRRVCFGQPYMFTETRYGSGERSQQHSVSPYQHPRG